MTWDQAQRYLDDGLATLVILSAKEVERLRAELGPVDLMAIEFRFDRFGVEQTATFTLTRAQTVIAQHGDGDARPAEDRRHDDASS